MLKNIRFWLIVFLLIGLLASSLPVPQETTPALAQVSSCPVPEEGAIVIGTTDLPVVLDPVRAYNFRNWEVLGHLFVGLTRQVPGTNEYELALATSHEVSEDGLTHTFGIRDDATFNDGTPITAETFVYSINRVKALELEEVGFVGDFVESVEADEDGNLVFQLTEPLPYFEKLVSLPPFFPLDANEFPLTGEGQPADDVQRDIRSINGNGVYVLDEVNPGDYIQLRRNPAYNLGEAPATDVILMCNYRVTEELRLALLDGEIDIAWRDVFLPAAAASAEANTEIEMLITPTARMWYLMLNQTRTINDVVDPVVRESVYLIMNRERVIQNIFDGYLMPVNTLLPSMLAGGYEPLWKSRVNSGAANALLRENDYRPGRGAASITVTTSSEGYGDLYASAVSSLADEFQQMVVIGMQVNGGVDFTAFTRAMRSGDYDAAVFAWTPPVVHPHAYLYPLLHSEGELARRNGYSSDLIDGLLEEAAAETDPEDQAEVYQRIQEALFPDYVIMPLWQDVVNILVRNDRVDPSSVVIDSTMYLHYELLEKQ